MHHLTKVCAVLVLSLTLGACESAYYATQEKFGNHKRDLLVDRAQETMETQEEAKEEFKDALEQFEAVIGVPDSKLKSVYNDLADSFEDAEAKAAEVSDNIESVEDVADDLFREWESEIKLISSASLRSKSNTQLRATKSNYASLIKAMKRAESRMEPVLTTFRDHVLFLKHNLNAQAINSLQGELGGIEADVGKLIQEMEQSINEAQSFIKTMESSG